MSNQVASLFATIGADTSEAIANVKKFVDALKGAANTAETENQRMNRDYSEFINNYEKQQQKAKEGTKKSSDALTTLGNKLLTVAAVYKAAKWMKEAMYESVAYADEVRNVSRMIGASTEESSRLIQVSELVGVTTNTLTMSMQQAIKRGYEPTIDGLKKMSEEYLALTDPMQRVLYLQERFGTRQSGGAGMAPLLELGPEKIEKYGADVLPGLVLTQQQVYQARQGAIILNDVTDRFTEFKYNFGSGLLEGIYKLITPEEDKINNLFDFASEMNRAGVTAEVFDEQMRAAAKSSGLVIDEFGDLRQEYDTLTDLPTEKKRLILPDIMGLARKYNLPGGEGALTQDQKDEIELNNTIRANVASIILKNAVTDDGVSVSEKYRSKMDELVEQEKEFQDILDEGTRKHWNARGKKMTEAAEGLAEVVKTQEELQDQFRQQYGTGIMNTLLTGGKNATPDTGMNVAYALGLVDEKTFGIESAIYDIADAWDGATDGIVDFSKWTEKTYNNLGDLKDIGLEATEGLPTGGQAEFYYNIIVTTYHRTSGGGDWAYSYSSGGKPADSGGANLYGPQVMHGGSFIGLAHGGIIPAGFGNDGYPINVSSGERVEVTPAGNKNIEGEGKPVYKFYGPVNLKVDGKNADFLRNFQQ